MNRVALIISVLLSNTVLHCDTSLLFILTVKKNPLCSIVVLLWKFPQKETHIEGTQTYVWRGLETAPTANKSGIKSHSAMISLTLNYEGWQNSGPSIPIYTHSEQRYWKKVTIRRVWQDFCIREWSHRSSLTFTWILLAVNVCPSTYFHFTR